MSSLFCAFSFLFYISNFNITICAFQSYSELYLSFSIVFSPYIESLSVIAWLCKHMFNMSRSKIKGYYFWPDPWLYGLLLFTFLTKKKKKKRPQLNSFKFLSCLTYWQRQELLEGRMTWNSNVVQRDRAVQETLEWVRLSHRGWWKEMKNKSSCLGFVRTGAWEHPAAILSHGFVVKVPSRHVVFMQSLMCLRQDLS